MHHANCLLSPILYPDGLACTFITHPGTAHVFRHFRPTVVGLRRRHFGTHPYHDRGRHHFPAPAPGASRAGPASGREPFLPFLAVAHHRDGDQGVGGDPSQAPREVRDRRTIPTARRCGASARCYGRARSFTARKRKTRRRWTKYGHGTPDDWIERNVYSKYTRSRRHAHVHHQLRPVRIPRDHDLGGADDVDSAVRGRRDQRYRPLLGLPQLPDRGCARAISCRGAS